MKLIIMFAIFLIHIGCENNCKANGQNKECNQSDSSASSATHQQAPTTQQQPHQVAKTQNSENSPESPNKPATENTKSVSVPKENDISAPLVSVGDDIFTNGVASINATASGYGIMTFFWSKVSGPGTVEFDNASAEDTSVTTSIDGTYVLRLTVNDATGNSAFDEITLVKDSAPPTAGIFLESTNIGPNGFTLKWSSASDNVNSADKIQYLVCSGPNAMAIDTVAKCEANTVEPYTANTLLLALTNLASSSTYYYNIVAKDTAGNKSLYEGKTQISGLVPIYTILGTENQAWLGSSVAGAGDVNGDGYADFIIGQWGADNLGAYRGKIYVYSGATGEVLYTKSGSDFAAEFGWSVAGAGDVNGDGKSDFIVGEPRANAGGNQRGKVYVYSGATGEVIYIISGSENNAYFGRSVAGAGDVNGDGFADLIIGEADAAAGDWGRGKVYVYSGSTGLVLFTISGTESGAHLGYSVAGAGDVNGDGKADFIASQYRAKAGGWDRGQVFVYSGATGSVLYTISGTEDYTYLGKSVAGAGDVNGDGKADFIIGATEANAGSGNGTAQGKAFVYSGATGLVLYTKTGSESSGYFGWSVAGAGDVNGDGKSDFIIGEPKASSVGFNRGKVYVYSGANGEILNIISGTEQSAQFGTSVAGAGDLNGDGKSDFIIGAPSAPGEGTARGKAYVYLSPSN